MCQQIKNYVVMLVIVLSLAACGGGGGSDGEPQDSTVEFNQFVLDEFELTEADEEAAEVNDITFSFDEDETAFDSLL